MRLTGLGRVLFAGGFAATGALVIVTADFALVWQPFAWASPWHDALAYGCGAILLASGVALLLPRTAGVAALALAGFLVVRELALQVPGLVRHPLVEASWYSEIGRASCR